MNKLNLIFIGQSHTQAIYEASKLSTELNTSWAFLYPSSDGAVIDYDEFGSHLNIKTINYFESLVADNSIVLSTIGGNAHNVLAMLQHNPSFDFFSPHCPQRPEKNEYLIPYETIKVAFQEILKVGDLSILDAAKRSLPDLKFHIESPPPPRSNELIKALLDPYFIDRYPDAIVADPWLRLKFYKLHSEIFKARCEDLGITFIPTPLEAVDSDGFLLPEFVSATSSTHANNSYGSLVIKKLIGNSL